MAREPDCQHPELIRIRLVESSEQRILGNFAQAHAALKELSILDRSVALASCEIFLDQQHYRKAVSVLEQVLPTGNELDFKDLEACFLRLLATVTRLVSISRKLYEAYTYVEGAVKGLIAYAKHEIGHDGMAVDATVEISGLLLRPIVRLSSPIILMLPGDSDTAQQIDALRQGSTRSSSGSLYEFLPRIEFLYWSVHLAITVNRYAKDPNWERLSPGLSRLQKLVADYCSDKRMVEAGEVIETYCHIIAAAPLLPDDRLVAEIKALIAIIPGIEDESRVALAVQGKIHMSLANIYHQYVCRRGGHNLEELRNGECQRAADLFRCCYHEFGCVTVEYLRRCEYGLYTNLKELADMAEAYGNVQFYGGQLLVLQFRADIAVTLRDYCAFRETVERTRKIAELTGVFHSETRYLYEPDTNILVADRGKILESGEAALEACLNELTPATGAEASLYEILANVNMDKQI
ncbi:hypothetical protein LTR17_020301 [Elasticomyces elasticus]|nr:hypothetical protein LTR17_020301 [Elasticomyces elasticus]